MHNLATLTSGSPSVPPFLGLSPTVHGRGRVARIVLSGGLKGRLSRVLPEWFSTYRYWVSGSIEGLRGSTVPLPGLLQGPDVVERSSMSRRPPPATDRDGAWGVRGRGRRGSESGKSRVNIHPELGSRSKSPLGRPKGLRINLDPRSNGRVDKGLWYTRLHLSDINK